MVKKNKLILFVMLIICKQLFCAHSSTILDSINNLNRVESLNQNVFFQAVTHGLAKIVREFISFEDVDINAKNSDGKTALMIAANYPHDGQLVENFDEIAKILLNTKKVTGNLDIIINIAKINNRSGLLKLISAHQLNLINSDEMVELMLPANSHHEIAAALMGAGAIDVTEKAEIPNQVDQDELLVQEIVERSAMINPRGQPASKSIVTQSLPTIELNDKNSRCVVC